jgi:hypothetical protein
VLRSTIHPAVPSPSQHRLTVMLASLLLALLPVGTVAQGDDGPAVDSPASPSLALERINSYRVSAGVPPMVADPALMEAAAGHIRYYEANRGAESLAGMGLHEQDSAAPGFTGVAMSDRAKAAGYDGGAVTENAGFGPLDTAVEWVHGNGEPPLAADPPERA